MKILHIGTEKSWRGGENQVRLLIEGLRERGVQSFAAYPNGSRAFERMKVVTDTLALPSRIGYDPRSILRLIKYCREKKIDILNAHSSAAMSLALAVKRKLPQLKLVVHRRVDIAIKHNFLTKNKYLNAKVDYYVAISNAIAGILIEYGIPQRKVVTVRSAVDEREHQNINRKQSRKNLIESAEGKIKTDTLVIGIAAALTQQKGHDVILRACAELCKKNIGFHCFIAGEGQYESFLKSLHAKLNLKNHVTFLGHIKNVNEFLAGLDVLMMPSTQEGLGTTLLDGAFAGCVLIGTRAGGIPEIIKHNETGILIDVGDYEALAEAIEKLGKDSNLREKYISKSLSYIRHEFSLDRMVEDNLQIYKKL